MKGFSTIIPPLVHYFLPHYSVGIVYLGNHQKWNIHGQSHHKSRGNFRYMLLQHTCGIKTHFNNLFHNVLYKIKQMNYISFIN